MQLEDNEEIEFDYEEGSFKYGLAYDINIEKTIENMKYDEKDKNRKTLQ